MKKNRIKLNYFDQALAAKKNITCCQDRILSAEETYSKIRPYFKDFGLTRIANITHLDKIDIPVTTAIRPQSLNVCVSSGKGINLSQAMTSAAMESIELFHAEHIDNPTIFENYENLAKENQMIPFDFLPLRKNSFFNKKTPIHWIMGWDLIQQQETPVPLEMVQMNYTAYNTPEKYANFLTGSNGLASGNCLIEAILSGLYEVIERDAVTLSKWKQKHGEVLNLIDSSSIPYTSIHSILNKINDSEISLRLIDCKSDINIPTFTALLFDAKDHSINNVAGFGTHLNPEVALIRAITEAAQGRCVYISGARDDIYQHDIIQAQKILNSKHQYSSEKNITSPLNLKNEADTYFFEKDLRLLLEKLKASGINQTIVINLSKNFQGISVIKVITPKLEGYLSQIYAPGPRARKIFLQKNHDNSSDLPPNYLHMPASKELHS